MELDFGGFFGQATVAIDSAGRTNFPKEFRKLLREDAKGQVIVTIAQDRTLALYPIYEWKKYLEVLGNLGSSREASQFRMRVTSMARASVLDGQYRVTLTPEQMAYAGITGDVTFVGEINRVRLWNPGRFVEEIANAAPEQRGEFQEFF